MGGGVIGVVLGLVFAVLLVPLDVAATDYVVGEGFGWQLPPNNSFYSEWLSSKTFRLGDRLVFNFITGSHDVATSSSSSDFDSCNKGIPSNSVQRTSPVTVNLNTTGQHYHYCTFDGHCSSGQKLSINVLGSGNTPPANGPSSPPPPGPPPPPGMTGSPRTNNSAPSLAAASAGFFVTFVSIAMGLKLL